jgi:hypothetical protein
MVDTEQGDGGVRAAVRAHRLMAFGALVVLLTIGPVALQLDKLTMPFALVLVPGLAALIVAAVADGRAGVGRLFRRIARWRVAPRWYAAALGIPVLMWLMIDAAGVALGTPVSALFGELATIPVVLLVVLLPGLLEEFGWRGFAVPASPRSWSVVKVALVVGVLFLIPHLVLYMPGQQYDNLPVWPLPLIIISGSVLYTWIFVGSGGSALLAGLMHAAMNGLTPLTRGIDPVVVWQLQGIMITIIAIAVVVLSVRMRRPLGAEIEPAGEPTAVATLRHAGSPSRLAPPIR